MREVPVGELSIQIEQKARSDFIESNQGFKETKTPFRLGLKFLEETKEMTFAYVAYLIHPTLEKKAHLGEELADVIHILCDTATSVHIDLGQAMQDKLAKDTLRFPPGSVPTRQAYRQRKRFLGER